MKKEDLVSKFNTILSIREFNYDGSWLDIELGPPLYHISVTFEKNPEYFNAPEIKELFNKAMSALKELVANNINNHFLLEASLGPGRKLFPDKEKHWWWYLPDKLMNEAQLKEWKKYLKKCGYK